MVVRIRLARHGTRNNPFYHLVAIRDKAARDARPIEKLGEYDPIPRPKENSNQPVQAWQQVGVSSSSASSSYRKSDLNKPILTSGLEKFDSTKLEKRIEWNVERIHYWLGVGAQPSKPVARLLDRAGLIPKGKWYKGMYQPPSIDSLLMGSVAGKGQSSAEKERKPSLKATDSATTPESTQLKTTLSSDASAASQSTGQPTAT